MSRKSSHTGSSDSSITETRKSNESIKKENSTTNVPCTTGDCKSRSGFNTDGDRERRSTSRRSSRGYNFQCTQNLKCTPCPEKTQRSDACSRVQRKWPPAFSSYLLGSKPCPVQLRDDCPTLSFLDICPSSVSVPDGTAPQSTSSCPCGGAKSEGKQPCKCPPPSDECPCMASLPPPRPPRPPPPPPCPAEQGRRLLVAAQQGRACEVQSLLNQGVDVNFTLASQWTALHRAASGGHANIVALLLTSGACVNATTAAGFTALHVAAFSDASGACARLLLDAGAEVNRRSRAGFTALHYAAEAAFEQVATMLVEAGACRSARNNWGKTPFDLARDRSVRALLTADCQQQYKCQ